MVEFDNYKNKSDIASDEYKIKGNEYFRQNQYFKALYSYNKALCFAESKEKLGLAYANRSVVYLELKKYDECLLNIQLARENEYPVEKIQKLNDREEKCKEANKVAPDEDAVNFLKLSYPANPKIPFIVDCLEVRKTEQYGRGIYTTQDLKIGDIVAIEPPAMKSLTNFGFSCGQYVQCCSCMKINMMNLLPCIKSGFLMFCSKLCQDKVYNEQVEPLNYMLGVAQMTGQVHEENILFEKLLLDTLGAFGGNDNLKEFILENDINKWSKTLFDFDFSDPNDPQYKANMIKAIISFNNSGYENQVNKLTGKIDRYITVEDVRTRNLVKEFMKRLLNVTYSIMDYLSGPFSMTHTVLKAFQALLNHQCSANIATFSTDIASIFYVTKPIKAGEQLFINYLSPSVSLDRGEVTTRQTMLYRRYFFFCKCALCVDSICIGNEALAPHLRIVKAKKEADKAVKQIFENRSAKEVIRLVKENWKMFEDYYADSLSHEAVQLHIANAQLLKAFSKYLTLPCDIEVMQFFKVFTDEGF